MSRPGNSPTICGVTSSLELFPKPWGRALTAVAIVLLVLALHQDFTPSADPTRAAATTVGALVLVATLLLRIFRVRHPAVVPAMGLSSLALVVAGSGLAIIGVVATVLSAAGQLARLSGALVSAAVSLAFLANTWYTHPGMAPLELSFNAVGLLFAHLLVGSMRRLREEQQRTADLLAELQENRDAQVQAAALQERARIAREIHDILAHTLSGLALQLEGTRLLLEQYRVPTEAVSMVERAHRLARDGLTETRRAVGALRGDRLPGPEQLAALAEEFHASSGTPTRFHVEGDSLLLPFEAQLALYRTAQEALTNASKHARPTHVEVCLRYAATGAELTVEDESSSAVGARLPSGGYGLAGLRERAELLGGCLEAGPTQHGFRVRLWLPT